MRRMVRLVDPDMCRKCPFMKWTWCKEPGREPGWVKNCCRKDCDNWITDSEYERFIREGSYLLSPHIVEQIEELGEK